MRQNSNALASVTAQEIEQTAVVQAELLELMKRLVSDGFDWRCVLCGGGMAIAEMVGSIAGPAKVPAHFAQLAALTTCLAAQEKR